MLVLLPCLFELLPLVLQHELHLTQIMIVCALVDLVKREVLRLE